jgi:DNA repair protein RadC
MKKKRQEIQYKVESTGYKAIREWRVDDRPRERLMKHGAETLSDAELLAILISSGAKGISAIDVARVLLDTHENLANISSCDYSQFKQIKGIGTAKAVTLAAAFEISKRIKLPEFWERNIIKTPQDLAESYIPKFRGIKKEMFLILLLNTSNQVFREVKISEGSLNASIVHPREVFRIAITESAASVILMHNHPSGNKTPSEEDIKITRQLVESGRILNIRVLDHLIIAGESYYSFASENLI